MFSFPLTDYINTLECIPFNCKHLLHLTKASLTVAAVRGPGFHRSAWWLTHMREQEKISTGHSKKLLKEPVSTCMYCRCIGNSSVWNAESTDPARPHIRLANISINAWMWSNEGLVMAFIKKPKAMWAALVLLAEMKNSTKKTFCGPKKVTGKWVLWIIDKSWDLTNVPSRDGLKIQLSHDRFFWGETGSVWSEMLSRSTTPQRDYIELLRAKGNFYRGN